MQCVWPIVRSYKYAVSLGEPSKFKSAKTWEQFPSGNDPLPLGFDRYNHTNTDTDIVSVNHTDTYTDTDMVLLNHIHTDTDTDIERKNLFYHIYLSYFILKLAEISRY